MPHIKIRPLRETDVENCLEIYRLNEPERFPEGYIDCFHLCLSKPEYLFLVAENDAGLCGFGGILFYEKATQCLACLAFGMVHPAHQGKGIGTALILSRLAILPEPSPKWWITLSPVPKSKTFYENFGFEFVGFFVDPFDQYRAESFAVQLTANHWKECREMLARAKIKLNLEHLVSPKALVSMGRKLCDLDFH